MNKLKPSLEAFEEKLKFIERQVLKNNANSIIGNPTSIFIKDKLEINCNSNNNEEKFLKAFIDLIKQSRNDFYEASHENTNNFMWRNFSFFVIHLSF